MDPVAVGRFRHLKDQSNGGMATVTLNPETKVRLLKLQSEYWEGKRYANNILVEHPGGNGGEFNRGGEGAVFDQNRDKRGNLSAGSAAANIFSGGGGGLVDGEDWEDYAYDDGSNDDDVEDSEALSTEWIKDLPVCEVFLPSDEEPLEGLEQDEEMEQRLWSNNEIKMLFSGSMLSSATMSAIQSLKAGQSIRRSSLNTTTKDPGKQTWTVDEDKGLAFLEGGFCILKSQYDRILPHQREGIAWMWSVHNNKQRVGGLLADDMGLGKTLQTITFIAGLIRSKNAKRFLIVMPLGLLENWKAEFLKWYRNVNVVIYYGRTKKGLKLVRQEGGVCLTTYDMIRLEKDVLRLDQENPWDYLILDEGHLIKNHTCQKAQAVRAVHCIHKLLLTGTPIQNNLAELWSLFDFLASGQLLGSFQTFNKVYSIPIQNASAKDADEWEKGIGEIIAADLREKIRPFFLRREKKGVFGENGASVAQKSEESKSLEEDYEAVEDTTEIKRGDVSRLSKKKEFVVWVKLSDEQIRLYEQIIESEDVIEALNKSKSALANTTLLKKICDHPRLLKGQTETTEEEEAILGDILKAPEAQQSAKLAVLLQLLDDFDIEGHRALIFSQSIRMLNIIAKALRQKNVTYQRIDGTVTDQTERHARVKQFNSSKRKFKHCLITTQIGVGISLTGADRVVIFDPSWNPSQDAQAVDRAFRVGQRKDVVVYRFLTCGTIEEKIYRNQVRKSFLSQTSITDGNNARYFKKAELKDMFVLDNTHFSDTERVLSKLHPLHKGLSENMIEVVEKLMKFETVVGLSQHDALYSVKENILSNSMIQQLAGEHLNKLNGEKEDNQPKEPVPRKRLVKKSQKQMDDYLHPFGLDDSVGDQKGVSVFASARVQREVPKSMKQQKLNPEKLRAKLRTPARAPPVVVESEDELGRVERESDVEVIDLMDSENETENGEEGGESDDIDGFVVDDDFVEEEDDEDIGLALPNQSSTPALREYRKRMIIDSDSEDEDVNQPASQQSSGSVENEVAIDESDEDLPPIMEILLGSRKKIESKSEKSADQRERDEDPMFKASVDDFGSTEIQNKAKILDSNSATNGLFDNIDALSPATKLKKNLSDCDDLIMVDDLNEEDSIPSTSNKAYPPPNMSHTPPKADKNAVAVYSDEADWEPPDLFAEFKLKSSSKPTSNHAQNVEHMNLDADTEPPTTLNIFSGDTNSQIPQPENPGPPPSEITKENAETIIDEIGDEENDIEDEYIEGEEIQSIQISPDCDQEVQKLLPPLPVPLDFSHSIENPFTTCPHNAHRPTFGENIRRCQCLCEPEELNEYEHRLDRFKRRLQAERFKDALGTVKKARLIYEGREGDADGDEKEVEKFAGGGGGGGGGPEDWAGVNGAVGGGGGGGGAGGRVTTLVLLI
ncbi:DNA excision repair protein ERCC-6-like [Chytridiales sp. JEL 0842]|nr:DNA excision repair protein ERCC-6-like [Chytridiales sp. JEL 0842]